jgi:hypothetical protein
MIRKYDIICLVERKTDDIDIVKLEGYEIHMKIRKSVAKNRSGGIILGYRQEIASKIKPLHTNSKTNVIIRNITSVTICVVQTSRTCMFSSAFLCRRVPRA